VNDADVALSVTAIAVEFGAELMDKPLFHPSAASAIHVFEHVLASPLGAESIEDHHQVTMAALIVIARGEYQPGIALFARRTQESNELPSADGSINVINTDELVTAGLDLF